MSSSTRFEAGYGPGELPEVTEALFECSATCAVQCASVGREQKAMKAKVVRRFVDNTPEELVQHQVRSAGGEEPSRGEYVQLLANAVELTRPKLPTAEQIAEAEAVIVQEQVFRTTTAGSCVQPLEREVVVNGIRICDSYCTSPDSLDSPELHIVVEISRVDEEA